MNSPVSQSQSKYIADVRCSLFLPRSLTDSNLNVSFFCGFPQIIMHLQSPQNINNIIYTRDNAWMQNPLSQHLPSSRECFSAERFIYVSYVWNVTNEMKEMGDYCM